MYAQAAVRVQASHATSLIWPDVGLQHLKLKGVLDSSSCIITWTSLHACYHAWYANLLEILQQVARTLHRSPSDASILNSQQTCRWGPEGVHGQHGIIVHCHTCSFADCGFRHSNCCSAACCAGEGSHQAIKMAGTPFPLILNCKCPDGDDCKEVAAPAVVERTTSGAVLAGAGIHGCPTALNPGANQLGMVPALFFVLFRNGYLFQYRGKPAMLMNLDTARPPLAPLPCLIPKMGFEPFPPPFC